MNQPPEKERRSMLRWQSNKFVPTSSNKSLLTNKAMRKLIWVLLLCFFAESARAQKPIFLRLYNSSGKKIDRGELFQMSDTSITLTRKNIFTETPITKVELIKSKRTTGHRILITSLSVVGVAAIVAGKIYSLSQPTYGYRDFSNKGGKSNKLTRVPRRPRPLKKYEVKGDTEHWAKQRELLTRLML